MSGATAASRAPAGSSAPAGSPASAGPWVRSCHGCGKAQDVPALAPGMAARCARCGTGLRQPWPGAIHFARAAAVAAVPLLAVGSTQTLAMVDKVGRQRTADLLDGPLALSQHGMWELGALTALTTMVMPALVVGLLIATLVGLQRDPGARWVASAFAWRNRLKPWAMIDVFLVGYFVAYSKLGALVHVEPGNGFWALAAFMVLMAATDAVLDPQEVWDEMGMLRHPPADAASAAKSPEEAVLACQTCALACTKGERCPRCASGLEHRKSDAVKWTAALGIAGLVMYVPANVLPVLTVTQLGHGSPSTILSGVIELAEAGQWPLAGIVFGASVAVPVMKILVLAVALWAAARHRARHPRALALLYRIVLVIGRWSMIDVFMESILSALVQFGTAAEVDPGLGAIPFASVVVLTMLAAERFDPRLIWDRARA